MRRNPAAMDRRGTEPIRTKETVMTETANRHHPTTPSEVPTAKEVELVVCPECGHPAEVEWRDELESTSGAVEHLKIRCLNRHWFLMPSYMLSR
jgi:hypothetical protein